MLLKNVPAEVAHGKGLVAQLALHLLPVLRQDVLVQGRHLLTTDMTGLLGSVTSRDWLHINIGLL